MQGNCPQFSVTKGNQLMQQKVHTGGDLGASNLRLLTKVGSGQPAFEWSTSASRYKGQPNWLTRALADYRQETGAPVPTKVGLTWPGYTNPLISHHQMSNPPRLVLDRDAFERENGISLVTVHDGAAHLMSTLFSPDEGGAQITRNIFGLTDEETEGAALALDMPGSGVALSAVIFDLVQRAVREVRTVSKTGEGMHGGLAVRVKDWSRFEHDVVWELLQLAEEGAFRKISPEGFVSIDTVLSARGLPMLYLAICRVLRTEDVRLDILSEDITSPEVLRAIVSGEESNDPRVVTVRTWYEWHGDLGNREIVGNNAYGGLVIGGLIAKLGLDVLMASGYQKRLVVGQHADKVGRTRVHLLTDPDSGIKGAFAAMELAAAV